MKNTWGIIFVSSLLLTGCSQASEPAVTESAKISMNELACQEFEESTHAIFDEAKSDSQIIAQFDESALKADGEVKSRLDQLVAFVSNNNNALYFMEPDDYNNQVASVARACQSEGFSVSPKVLPGFKGAFQ